jgi:NAD(P)-dependent dehydrogenase (short-subunit alcohol dehydrogenase family)
MSVIPPMSLQGKIAIITGADGPIGAATALRFVREGATVVLNDVVSGHLDGVLREIVEVEGGTALIVLGDVTRSAHVDRMMRETLDSFGRIDVLVNHAGATEEIAFAAASLCAEAVLPHMREQRWGRVINSATAASVGTGGQASVDILAKSVITLTRALAVENGRFGVTVNCVAAGLTAAATPTEAWTATLAQIPVGRAAEPREIAAAHVFLASEEASYVTGQVLYVDGGLSVTR